MKVSKNKDTNSLLQSEKKSLYRFLMLYGLMIASIVFLISLFYYQSQEKLMFSNKRATLSTYAYEHIKRLKSLHHFFPEQVIYPRDTRYKSAIYDIEKQKIFSELNSTSIQFDNEIYHTGDKMHYMKSLDEYYLGAKYLFLEVPYDETWKVEAWKNIATFGTSLSLFFMIIGLFLAKLFVRPMKESIELLDMFIKDTTHELNTPLSSILANIEMIDKDGISDENKRKINRIEIAAKTVSVLYNDLTYLTLENDTHQKYEEIDLKLLLLDRIEYFHSLASSKMISVEVDLTSVIFHGNRHKLIRVIDNLISNSIKYNRHNGVIRITLKDKKLNIYDSGTGMQEHEIEVMFERYKRFNSSEGGFGIGLSIVKKILDEYDAIIEVTSKKGEWTMVEITW